MSEKNNDLPFDDAKTRPLDAESAKQEMLEAMAIGPYKVVRKIGHGGMGVVWEAVQTEPVKRTVALKVIRSGFDNKEILARFDAERQALALMNHPNIARIIDAGATEDGHPYFAMEYVEGTPLTEYCDQNRLSIEQRLELFQDVCAGVQHANQKGIIHRDLKPGNILVTEIDGKPVPKVIDFGLAKATQANQRLTDATLFTQVGQILGTVKYMSPEQAGGGEELSIDTRSDVYSLGVILYELLTGSTPLEEQTLRGKTILQLMKLICDEEPPKPSSRISSISDEEKSSVTNNRRAEMGQLNRILEGDLDWIVMKALEKNRPRRYESAAALADDIARHRNHDPVTARPPSFKYRLGKFVRKNTTSVIASCLVLIAVSVGLTVAIWGWVNGEIARADAKKKVTQNDSKQKQENLKKSRELNERLAENALNQGRNRQSQDPLEAAHYCVTASSDQPKYDAARECASLACRRLTLRAVLEHSDDINFGRFVSDNPDRVMTWGYDGKVQLWNLDTCKSVKKFNEKVECFDARLFDSKSKLASFFSDGLYVWDLKKDDDNPILKVSSSRFRGGSILNDREMLIVEWENGKTTGQIRSFDTNSPVARLNSSTGHNRLLENRDYLAIAGRSNGGDDELNMWRVYKCPDSEDRRQFIKEFSSIRSDNPIFALPKNHVITFGGSSRVKVWQMPACRLVWQTKEQIKKNKLVTKLWVDNKRDFVMVGYSDRCMLFRISDGAGIGTFFVDKPVNNVTFLNEKLFLFRDSSENIQLYQLSHVGRGEHTSIGFKNVRQYAVDPTGKFLAFVDLGFKDGNRVTVFELETGDLLGHCVHTSRVCNIRFSSDGSQLLTCGRTVRIWQIDNNETMTVQYPDPSKTQLNAELKKVGKKLRKDTDVGGRLLLSWFYHPDKNRIVRINGTHVAYADSSNSKSTNKCLIAAHTTVNENGISVFDGKSGELVGKFRSKIEEKTPKNHGFLSSLYSNKAGFSPDATAVFHSGHQSVAAWKLPSGDLHFEKEYQKAYVTTCAWSPDGTLLAVPCSDGNVEIFSMREKKVIGSYRHTHIQDVVDVDRPVEIHHMIVGMKWVDDRKIASWSLDGSIIIFDCEKMIARSIWNDQKPLTGCWCFVSQHNLLAVSTDDRLLICKLDTDSSVKELELRDCSKLIPIGNAELAALTSNQVTLIELKTGSTIAQLQFENGIKNPQFSESGKHLIFLNDNRKLNLWNYELKLKLTQLANNFQWSDTYEFKDENTVEIFTPRANFTWKLPSRMENDAVSSLKKFELKTGTRLDKFGNLKALTAEEFMQMKSQSN